MTDKNKSKGHPILDLIFRLATVYLAATCFFYGWQTWQNEEYLKSAGWFLLSFSQVGQIFGWSNHESKIVRRLMWIPLILAVIFFVLSGLS